MLLLDIDIFFFLKRSKIGVSKYGQGIQPMSPHESHGEYISLSYVTLLCSLLPTSDLVRIEGNEIFNDL